VFSSLSKPLIRTWKIRILLKGALMILNLDLVDLLRNPVTRRSLNSDLKAAETDLRVLYLSPDQLDSFDSFGSDIPLGIDSDGLIGVYKCPGEDCPSDN